MSEAAPTVFVVDDDPAVLKGLERLLRSARLNVATFASPQEFLQRHDPRTHGCVLLDVAMPGLNGLELQQALAAGGSATPIVFLTGQGDVPTSVRAMKRGALDFLTKPVDDEDLLAAVHAALRNDQVMRRARAEVDDIVQRLATLTPREREVLGHVIAGHLNKQAAAEMGTVEKTIKVHRARMMEKMGVQSVAELVRLAEKAQVAPAAHAPPPTAC
jgi:FixJ family two-component response regulator